MTLSEFSLMLALVSHLAATPRRPHSRGLTNAPSLPLIPTVLPFSFLLMLH